MHRANLDHMSSLLALEDTVATTPSHAGNVQKLCAIDKMIICDEALANLELIAKRQRLRALYVHMRELQERMHTFSPSNAYTLGFNLKAKAPFIFPKSCGYSRLDTRRRNLTCGIKGLLRVGLAVTAGSGVRIMWMTSTHR